MKDRIWEYTKEPPTTTIEVEALDEGEALSDWVNDQVRQALKEYVRDGLQVRRAGDRLEVRLFDGGYDVIVEVTADWPLFVKGGWVSWDNGVPIYNEIGDEECEE